MSSLAVSGRPRWTFFFQTLIPPFTAWMESLSGEDQPPIDERGPYDEPSGDGMSNLLKYALGLMPMVPSPEAAPKVAIISKEENGIENNYLAVELKRSPEAGVGFTLEGFQDLVNWEPVSFIPEITGASFDNREHVRLISEISITESNIHFIRLIISEL